MCETTKSDHIHPILETLLWLPVTPHIQYKSSTICFNSISSTVQSPSTLYLRSPQCLSDLLQPYNSDLLTVCPISFNLVPPISSLSVRSPLSDLLQPYTSGLITVCPISFNLIPPISSILQPYTPTRQLRSTADSRTFVTPRVNIKTLGERTVSYIGPSVWNRLPQTLRQSDSFSSFKAASKTHLFNNSF